MKIIFYTEGVKREIEAPFEICTSRADLMALRDQIDAKLSPPEDSEGYFSYGWFTIWPRPRPSAPNTPPKKWTE
jgi:hypothetical protein